MKAQQPNTPTKISTQAIECLKLAEQDPVLSFYRGVECFEAREFELALTHFLASGEQHMLYAAPYIHEICDKPLVKNLSEEITIQRARIDSWYQYLIGVNVGQKSFFNTSCELLKLADLKAKDQKKPANNNRKKKSGNKQKKSKYQREVESFLANTNNPHQLYHQAQHHKNTNPPKYFNLLIKAVAHGHMLAMVDFMQEEVQVVFAEIYSKELIQSAFHQQYQHLDFADRLFNLAVSKPQTDGKKELHFAALNLGVAQATSLVASIYYLKHKRYHDAFQLASLGCTRNDGQALSILLSARSKTSGAHTNNEFTTVESIITTLIKNLRNENDNKHFEYSAIENYRQFVQQNNLNLLFSLFDGIRTLPIFYNNDALLNLLLHILKEQNQNELIHAKLKILIADMYMKRILHSNDKSEKIALFPRTIQLLREAYAKLKDINLLLDSFYLSLEFYQTELDVSQQSKKETIQRLRGIVVTALIIRKWVETIIDPNEYNNETIIKYSNYSMNALRSLFALAPAYKDTHLQDFQYFIELGAKAKNTDAIICLARCYTTGSYGYPQDHHKALALLQPLSKGQQSLASVEQLQAICYIQSKEFDSQKGIRILEQHANDNPEFHMILANLYDDGYLGIPQDRTKAEHFFQQAVAGGVLEAHVGLGLMAKDRCDHAANEETAQQYRAQMVKHLELAFNSGSCDAAFFLGKAYLVGTHMPKNLALAQQYFKEAVTRSGHAHAKAILAMMAAGYQGEQRFDGKYELIRLQTLKDCGNLDQDPFSMFDYGLILLNTDPQCALEYIHKSALYYNVDAQHLLATIQCLIDHPQTDFSPEVVHLINHKNYRSLITEQNTPDLHQSVEYIFAFAKVIKQYLAMDFPIPFEYVVSIFTQGASGTTIDIDGIKAHIKEHFPSEKETNRQKTLILANQFSNQSKAGDNECRIATEQLLKQQQNVTSSLQKKLNKATQSNKMSMKDLSNCIEAFLKTGIKLEGKQKKAVRAAQTMHPPHGRGDRNPNQPLEGGRQQTAQDALSVMSKVLK